MRTPITTLPDATPWPSWTLRSPNVPGINSALSSLVTLSILARAAAMTSWLTSVRIVASINRRTDTASDSYTGSESVIDANESTMSVTIEQHR